MACSAAGPATRCWRRMPEHIAIVAHRALDQRLSLARIRLRFGTIHERHACTHMMKPIPGVGTHYRLPPFDFPWAYTPVVAKRLTDPYCRVARFAVLRPCRPFGIRRLELKSLCNGAGKYAYNPNADFPKDHFHEAIRKLVSDRARCRRRHGHHDPRVGRTPTRLSYYRQSWALACSTSQLAYNDCLCLNRTMTCRTSFEPFSRYHISFLA